MGEPLAIPLFWAAIFSNNSGREKGNKGKLWAQTEVSCRFFTRPPPSCRTWGARRRGAKSLSSSRAWAGWF